MLKYRVAVSIIFHLKILAEVKKKALKKRRTLQSSALQSEASEEGRGRGVSGAPLAWQIMLPTGTYVTLGYTKVQLKVTDIFWR